MTLWSAGWISSRGRKGGLEGESQFPKWSNRSPQKFMLVNTTQNIGCFSRNFLRLDSLSKSVSLQVISYFWTLRTGFFGNHWTITFIVFHCAICQCFKTKIHKDIGHRCLRNWVHKPAELAESQPQKDRGMFSPEVEKIQGTINAHHVHFTYGDDLDSAALKEGKSGTFQDQMKSIHDRLDETLEAEDVGVFAFCDSDIQIFRFKNSLFVDRMSACPLVLSINVKIWGEITKWFVKDFSVMLFQKRKTKTCKKGIQSLERRKDLSSITAPILTHSKKLTVPFFCHKYINLQ